MNERVYEYLMKLPKKNLVNLMWAALDEMQSYNGRSRMHCIMTALGAKEVEEYHWRLPDISDAKKNTNDITL